MNFNSDISCIDRFGNRNQFKYNVEQSEEDGNVKWIFRIVSYNLNSLDWFEFAVTEVDSLSVKVTTMAHQYNPEYAAKGIPDKMIEEAARVLGLNVYSSSNKCECKSFENEWRSTQANKVWTRLETNGLAVYDQQTDTFKYIGSVDDRRI